MIEMMIVGLLILGALWLVEHIGLYLFWSALGMAALTVLFVTIIFVWPIVRSFLINL